MKRSQFIAGGWHNFRYRAFETPAILLPLYYAIIALLDVIAFLSPKQFVTIPSLQALPEWQELGIQMLWLAGGVALFLAFTPRDNIVIDWLFQRLTWIFSGLGWLGYGVAVIATYPQFFVSWSSSVLLIIISVLRLIKINQTEHIVRKSVFENGEGTP